MAFSTQEIQDIYQRQAKLYDLYVQFYRLIGLNIDAYRTRAIDLLHLQRGDSVVELGCGTGLNFPLLMDQIGPQGRLIGVDLSSAMLTRARAKAARSGWTNVELVQGDVAVYDFPERVKGVLSTGTFGYVAEYDRVIEQASRALVPGGRLVIVDGKPPARWPRWVFKLFLWSTRPFGVTAEYFKHPCWESVERYFQETTFEELYGGLLYISAGTATSAGTK